MTKEKDGDKEKGPRCAICGGDLGVTANPFCRRCAELHRDECAQLLVGMQYRKKRGLLALFNDAGPGILGLIVLILIVGAVMTGVFMRSEKKEIGPPKKTVPEEGPFDSPPSMLTLAHLDRCDGDPTEACKGQSFCVVFYGKIECPDCEKTRRFFVAAREAVNNLENTPHPTGFVAVVDDGIDGTKTSQEVFGDSCYVDAKWSIFRLAGLRKLPVVLKVDKVGRVLAREHIEDIISSTEPEEAKIRKLFERLKIRR